MNKKICRWGFFLVASIIVPTGFALTTPPTAEDTPPALPSIFLAKPADAPAAKNFSSEATTPAVVSPLSTLTKQRITASVLNDVRLAHSEAGSTATSATTPASNHETAAANDVVTMERYIVRAEHAPTILLPVGPEHPFLDAIKSGRLYRHVGQRVTTEANLWASNMEGPFASSHVASTNTPRVTRVELAFRMSW